MYNKILNTFVYNVMNIQVYVASSNASLPHLLHIYIYSNLRNVREYIICYILSYNSNSITYTTSHLNGRDS